jgi:dihydrofolate reductase
MGEIHATMNISIDGCCDHTQTLADDEFHVQMSNLFERADALLFGRNTYDLLHAYWPGAASKGEGSDGVLRLARILDGLPKYVASSMALAPGWKASRIDSTLEAIRSVRDEVEGTLLLVASPTLARVMLQWKLIKLYHVWISPMVAGHGPQFLAGLERPVTPSLLDINRLRSGVTMLRYEFADEHVNGLADRYRQ